MLEIVLHPNKILRQKSAPIELESLKTAEFKALVKEMTETMFTKDGAGLAAPQIGLNIRLIIVNKNGQAIPMINPEITKKSWAKEIDEEGCLSVLNKKGISYHLPVARHKKIYCSYFDIKGKKNKIEANSLLARIIQHETDHLDGILFIDRVAEQKAELKTKQKIEKENKRGSE
ncbi:MAG TPA: peptide deformylase [bacterium]|nr:peptide deformylase [bacterium]